MVARVEIGRGRARSLANGPVIPGTFGRGASHSRSLRWERSTPWLALITVLSMGCNNDESLPAASTTSPASTGTSFETTSVASAEPEGDETAAQCSGPEDEGCAIAPEIFCDDGTCKSCIELGEDEGNARCHDNNVNTPICGDDGNCRACLVGECNQGELCYSQGAGASCLPCGDIPDPEAANTACAEQLGETFSCLGNECRECLMNDDCVSQGLDEICDPMGKCVPCSSNAECDEISEIEPICDPDPDTGCRPCYQHSECDEVAETGQLTHGACDIRVGTCFPEPTVMPLPTDPELDLNDMPGAHIIILVEGDVSFGVNLTIPDNTKVALLGSGITWSHGLTDPLLTVSGPPSSSFYIHDIVFDGQATSAGVELNVGQAWVDRTIMRKIMSGPGLTAGNTIFDLRVHNSIIAGIGDALVPGFDFPLLSLGDGGYLEIKYSTLVRADHLVECSGGWGGSVKNSIFGYADCPSDNSCEFLLNTTGSVLDNNCINNIGAGSADNKIENPALDWWGCALPNSCNYILAVDCDHDLAGAGTWSTGLKTPVDISGTPRPSGLDEDTCADFPGANIPPNGMDCSPRRDICR